MSRIDELKKQFPELNLTIFDLFKRVDTSSTYKYFPLLCKILGKRFSLEEHYPNKFEIIKLKLEIHEQLLNKGISTVDLTDNELFFIQYLTDMHNEESFFVIKDFIRLMDKNQITNKDVTSYSTIDELRSAITLASMKELTKDLEGQVIKEFEDDRWLVVRPLTFQSSSKYGASTRWCTTYEKDKQYFEKYWQNGVLVYFINRQTGYKFAGYKSLRDGDELSFWNAEDNRVDYLNLVTDDYLFLIVKRILNSNETNKELCTIEIQNQVMSECRYNEKLSEPMLQPMYDGPEPEEMGEVGLRMGEGIIVTQRVTRNMFDENMIRMGREIGVDETVGEIGYDERPMRA